MGKIRINKLALELNIPNDKIIDELKKKDVPVKNHMSSIDGEMAEYVRGLFTDKSTVKAKKKAATKKAVAKKVSTVAKPITAKIAAKAAAKKKADQEKQAAEDAKKPKPIAKPKAAPAKVKKEDTESDKPRKLGLKVVVKPEETEKKKQAKAPKEKPAAKKKKEEPKSSPAKKPPEKEPVEAPPVEAPVEEETFEVVQLMDNMPLRDVAEKLKCTPNDIIMDLMTLGSMATINQSLSLEVASKIADQRGFEVEVISPELELGFEEEEEEDLEKNRIPRPPIVTIMGHVDHGKTSLLDAIRKTSVTDDEAGGITQHIGAYQVKIKDSTITFLDTPGHEAFTAMRARGAQVTDIVILVVAADDGIKPQTLEAIHHANAGGVPLLVAINKIDKPDAKPDEVQKQLADQGLLPEEWGGQTIYTKVSAKERKGIDHLLEMILLQAEVMELKANPNVGARGVIIESHLDKGRGPVATLMIQKGQLKVGDPFIAGNYFGKVRAMVNDQGKEIQHASLSTPVEVIGLPEVPTPGDTFLVVQDEKRARQLSNLKIQRKRESVLSQKPRITMEDLHQQIVEGKIHELNLIIKADVQGSIQAVQEAFNKLETDRVRVKIIHDAVGGITESDILLASASNAIIIGFNVRPTFKAEAMAAKEKVDVRLYSIIYEAIEDVQKALEGLLEPTFREKIMGRAEVRKVFSMPKIGVIAGCQVISGTLERNSQARLVRDNVVIYEGKIQSLRRFKDDVKEVASGYECGLALDKYQDLKQGDIVEPFILEEVAP
ncbi:MAG TPA: translation initiation factor IF-2 [Desulfobacteria bacterium]|nr:translation initiation factor IF-2 [Desulfobacteria bacterium]